jgi:hypothetical protein
MPFKMFFVKQYTYVLGNLPSSYAGGRRYDHYFLRFSTIFGEKIGVILKNQSYDQFLHSLA